VPAPARREARALSYNLLSLHGLYYSTHGGWWEWAPPCNHFRMPYWKHMRPYMDAVRRLSYLMSQGHHRGDVAVVYPVAAKEAGLDGDASVAAAFTQAVFRARGRVELWDPWTGTSRALPISAQTRETTTLKLPLGETEPQLIVFSPGRPETAPEPALQVESIAVEGDWEFELQPVLDNRFGDYHWPPTPSLVGAEVRQLEVSDSAEGPWRKASVPFGPQFWKLGPVPDDFDESLLIALSSIDPTRPVAFGGREFRWSPYEFSWRWGREGDPGHQGYHGLKSRLTDAFLCLGAPRQGKNETQYGPEPGGTRYYLWTSVPAARATTALVRTGGLEPAAHWVNHARAGGRVALAAGANPLLVRYDQPGRGFLVVQAENAARASAGRTSLAMSWWNDPAVLPFDVHPERGGPVGCYRFTAPPGLRGLEIEARGTVRAWADGEPMPADGRGRLSATTPKSLPVPVLLRIEHERGHYGGAAFTGPIGSTAERAASRSGTGRASTASTRTPAAPGTARR
jgi:hypothetical protein